jgi:hypothetical protein
VIQKSIETITLSAMVVEISPFHSMTQQSKREIAWLRKLSRLLFHLAFPLWIISRQPVNRQVGSLYNIGSTFGTM